MIDEAEERDRERWEHFLAKTGPKLGEAMVPGPVGGMVMYAFKDAELHLEGTLSRMHMCELDFQRAVAIVLRAMAELAEVRVKELEEEHEEGEHTHEF